MLQYLTENVEKIFQKPIYIYGNAYLSEQRPLCAPSPREVPSSIPWSRGCVLSPPSFPSFLIWDNNAMISISGFSSILIVLVTDLLTYLRRVVSPIHSGLPHSTVLHCCLDAVGVPSCVFLEDVNVCQSWSTRFLVSMFWCPENHG